MIAGTWLLDAGGLDAAVWLPKGSKWFRQDSAAQRSPIPNRSRWNPARRAAPGSAMILSGSVITFGDGAEQRAAAWIWPNRSSAWTLQQLPDAGIQSEALSSACVQTRWVSGHADGRLACGAST